MKYAFMTFSTPDMALADVLAAARQYGYDGIELRIDGGQKVRPRAASMHRHVFAPSPFAHEARVARGEFHRHIATHRGDAQQFDGIARGEGEEQSDGVVDTGIAVVDDGSGSHAAIVQRSSRVRDTSCGNELARGS